MPGDAGTWYYLVRGLGDCSSDRVGTGGKAQRRLDALVVHQRQAQIAVSARRGLIA